MSIYLKTYLLGFSLLLLSGIFNFIVDPYGIHNIINIDGVNSPKSEMQNHEKLFKAYMIGKLKPKAIAVGTSRTDFGIDPSTSFWGQIEPRYNIALAGGDLYVTRRYIEHISKITHVKKAVIGLDFFTFNAMRPQAADYNGDILAVKDDGLPNPFFMREIFFKSTLTMSVLRESYKTIINSRNNFAHVLNFDTGMRQFVFNHKPPDMRNLHNIKITDKKKRCA